MNRHEIETPFGNTNIEEIALAQALVIASGATAFDSDNNGTIYEWLEITPKTSLCVHLADALKELGYAIVIREEVQT